MFDKHLIRAINTGRCLALVGSGLSCELGYPSWSALAHRCYQHLKARKLPLDEESYEKYLDNEKYPELFRQLQRDLGENRQSLVDLIKPELLPEKRNNNNNTLYQLITRWPFAGYLTTNYDDEISLALTASGHHFGVIQNRPEDFHVWRDGVSHIVQKLHSDLDHPNEVVITSEDYRRLQFDSALQYFRDRLKTIFTSFDILIVGHSLSDPDIAHILQLAKETASPEHPIYFVSSDFTKAEETELFEQYNVVLTRYRIVDHSHAQLQRLLRAADRYIVPRSHRSDLVIPSKGPNSDLDTAISIYLFRKLHGSLPANYLATIVLSAMAAHPGGELPAADVAKLSLLASLKAEWSKDNKPIVDSLSHLEREGLITLTGAIARPTSAGHAKVDQLRALRKTERDQAYGQFELSLKALSPSIDNSTLAECSRSAEAIVAASFAARGATIARTVFGDRSRRPDELSDTFALVSDHAARFPDLSTRAAFVEAVHQLLVEPNTPQRDYLASVSQGFFLYHALGLDPRCGDVRNEIFRNTLWFCDSSVLLPLVALGCHNHEYADSLFGMLAEKEALVCTTPRLLQEVWEHFQWAARFAERFAADSLEYLRAALVKGDYKQNLFLDGYIRLSAEGTVGSFSDYMNLIDPSQNRDQDSFMETARAKGIRLVSFADFPGMGGPHSGEFERTKSDIEKERRYRDTYRAPLQVECEAELLIILKGLRSKEYSMNDLANLEHFYFVSRSHVIDSVSQESAVITWSPEAVYRYISALSGNNTDPHLLQQCMLHEYYYTGLSFIDRARYERFFGPNVDAARASYQEERSSYIADMERAASEDVDKAFEATDDLEKPFFVEQMGWVRAREAAQREKSALIRARTAEEKVSTLEQERERAWKVREARTLRQDETTKRNAQDPKHVRKRQRQAKKRRRQRKR